MYIKCILVTWPIKKILISMTRFNLDITYILLFDATYAACFVYHIATFIVIQQISNCAS
jgi:hypothetical protein